jgi:hypothetical protein
VFGEKKHTARKHRSRLVPDVDEDTSSEETSDIDEEETSDIDEEEHDRT